MKGGIILIVLGLFLVSSGLVTKICSFPESLYFLTILAFLFGGILAVAGMLRLIAEKLS